MTIQLHEEYENGKSCLLRPHCLLYLFASLRRQPQTRINLRRGAAFGFLRVDPAEAPWWMDLPLHLCTRLYEHEILRRV